MRELTGVFFPLERRPGIQRTNHCTKTAFSLSLLAQGAPIIDGTFLHPAALRVSGVETADPISYTLAIMLRWRGM